jgi:hypothetical protein
MVKKLQKQQKGGAKGGKEAPAGSTKREREDAEIKDLEQRIAAEMPKTKGGFMGDWKKFHELPISNYTLEGAWHIRYMPL